MFLLCLAAYVSLYARCLTGGRIYRFLHNCFLSISGFGVIASMTVEDGFRKVDRKFFVPKASQRSMATVYNFFRKVSNLSSVSQNRQEMAHSDQPLKEGNVHISAPHIYGSVLEALELRKDTSLSFLNAGSGTGYLTCIAATILGPRSSHYCKKEHTTIEGAITRNLLYSQPSFPDSTLQVLKSTKMW
jgi:hypothetical protein